MLYWTDKEYEGEIKNGKPHGIGKITTKTKDYSDGWFSLLFPDVNYEYYEGGYRNGEKHGVIIYTSSSTYQNKQAYIYLNGNKEYDLTRGSYIESDTIVYKKDEPTTQYEYNGNSEKESSQNWVEKCIREGRYDEVKRELDRYGSNEEFKIFIDGSFSTKSANDWQDTLDSWKEDENNNSY